MRRKLSTILNEAEQQMSGAKLSTSATMLLASVYGKLHALFLPYRVHPAGWPEIRRLRRGYINGTLGIAAAVSGQKNWVAGHDARTELENAGLAIAVKGASETTGLILAAKGRAVACAMCGELCPSILVSGAMVARLASMEPDRIRGEERWVSESKLFGVECSGPTDQWQFFTDMLLEPAASGSVDSTADVQGHVFYRYLKPFEELPEADGIEPCPSAEDSYLHAFKSELARLRRLEPIDGEICIPLSVT